VGRLPPTGDDGKRFAVRKGWTTKKTVVSGKYFDEENDQVVPLGAYPM